MKRLNNLFDGIVDYQNIRLAFLQAIRGNRKSPKVHAFCRNIDSNLRRIRDKLTALDCDWGNYHSFTITDPKLRVISTAPIEQRIMHHAIMNVLESVFDRPMICHSYACRKGKGTHAALLYAFHQGKHHPYFLKLDVRKYFLSIDHEVLKAILARYIKDIRVLSLLNAIIDSYETDKGKGIPIGNLTSQFFANLYLAGLDHFVLEQLRPSAYCRYMDDFVLWAHSKAALKTMLHRIDAYVTDELRLTLKQAICGKSDDGLPFLGFLLKDSGIYLLRKSKRRVTDRMACISTALYKEEISEEKAAEQIRSVFAAINLARTQRFRALLCRKWEVY
jgi:hypothetical protein